MFKAIIKKYGKYNKFRFVLKGKNGEIIATGEGYNQKQSCKKTLAKYFPDFEVVDETLKVKKSQQPRILLPKKPLKLTTNIDYQNLGYD